MRTRIGVWGTAVVLAMLLAACGDEEAPDTTAPQGFTVVRDADDGFAIAVPAVWTQVPMGVKAEEFDRNANRLRGENPKLASALVQARVVSGGGGKMLAIDPEGRASVNLTVDKAEEKNLAEIVQKSKARLGEFGATNLTETPVTLDGEPATKLSFRLPLETDNGTVTVAETQYYQLRGGKKAYILTVIDTDDALATLIADSLRIR
ncbi:MAG: hypothetical protein M3O23_05145 [Actinomycetota bacterium]|nr:hypothetical protein [Actinomycetota bacterium]